MELKVKKEYFHQAISEVSNVISSKAQLPILSGIKLLVSTDSLTLIGSNGDIFIERTIPKEIDGFDVLEIFQTGSVVISAKYLSELVKKLPDDISLKLNENQSVTIQSGDIKTKLNGLHAEEYPTLPVMDFRNPFELSSEDLIEMVKQTVFATSKSDTKPVLTGVNFTFENGFLTCAATNSQRLSLKKYEVNAGLIGSFILPRPTLLELVKLFGGTSPSITLFISGQNIGFKSREIALYSRLIDGTYPNIQGLIPEQSKTRITLDTKQLLKGIDRASLFANEWRNNNIQFQIIDATKLKISSKSTEMGEIEELQLIEELVGDVELNVVLDGNYLMESLKAIQSREVSVHFNGSMRPVLIHGKGDDSLVQLISPVRAK
jgi:DNA polymerase III subunit beta